MKTPTIPTLLGPDGMTSLREYAGYHGGGSGFGGQLRAWNPPVKVWMQPCCPTLPVAMPAQTIWCAITAMPPTPSSCIRDHIVGSFRSSPKLALFGHRGGRSPCLFPRG
ncbi:phage portal protein [Escherichia coli]|uniref:phage portal protein n=1 Tax=Escherichia coli TaxID=562 RepID=UPI003890CE1E